MIKGGYILQPRKIDDSDISKSPPHVREIWSYLIRKANHSDNKDFKRGQLFTSYKQIINDLSWFVGYRKESYKKHHCEIAMKVLTKANMITTMKTTRGMIITICNYEFYQDPKNYENDTKKIVKNTGKRQSNDTINKNDKNVNNDNINFYRNQMESLNGEKYVKEYNMIFDYITGKNDLERQLNEILSFPEQLTYKQFEKLFDKSKKKQFSFKETLMTITNKKDYWHKKTSLYLTLNGWINRSKDK